MKIRIAISIILAIILFSVAIFSIFNIPDLKNKLGLPGKTVSQVSDKPISVQPKVTPTTKEGLVQYPEDYNLLLVGDSMTDALGNSTELRNFLKSYYPNSTFEVLNYGFGSTNIQSVLDRLTKTTFYGRDFRPILDINFDLILIESFGHNPLSEYPLEEGLKKQTEALDNIVATIEKVQPKEKIVFVATISPNKIHYGEGTVNLTVEERIKWANERISYIKNHIEYAKTHSIPVINIFEKSLDANGDGNLNYINTHGHIHPSASGVVFISHTIADFLHQNNLLK